MKKLKRMISLLLMLCIITTIIPADVLAVGTAISEKERITLAETSSESVAEILSLSIDGSTAIVRFRYDGDNALIGVAVYEKQTGRMVTYNSANISADDGEVSIPLRDEIPDEYTASAFLLEQGTMIPLCAKYDFNSNELMNEMAEQLDVDCTSIVADYLNENGLLDVEDARNCSQSIYAWAEQLSSEGVIEDCSYNDESNTVAFFLKDGSTYLYIPAVEGFYSGNVTYDDLSVVAVNSLGGFSSAVISAFSLLETSGAHESADYINSHLDVCKSVTKLKSGDITLDSLKEYIEHIGERNVRAIFWRGHGTVYTDKYGNKVSVFGLNEKSSKRKDKLYRASGYLDDSMDNPPAVVYAGKNYCITSYFFDRYMDEVDGGMFYSGTCQGAGDNGNTARIILGKGFECYVGASSDIWTTYSDKMMGSVAEHLCEKDSDGEYFTIQDALSIAQLENGNHDIYGTKMLLYQNPNTEYYRLPKKKYERFDIGMTWTEAKAYCEKMGGHLVTITSAEEQSYVESLVVGGTQNQYWLGGYNDGSWRWVTGEAWSYSHWAAGEPNDYRNNESYAQIYRIRNPHSGGAALHWNDISVDNHISDEEDFFTTDQVGFICEWD